MTPATREHPATCPRCGTLQPHKGRRDLLELVRQTHARLEKAVTDADHRRGTREDVQGGENALLLYEAETTIHLIEAVQAAASLLRRELYAADGGCLKCLDALHITAPERCTVCGARGPGCGPDGRRCRSLGCTGSIA